MTNMNLVVLSGQVTRDPELRYVGTSGAALVQFGVAVNKEFVKDGEKKKIATFVDCKAWRDLAEFISATFKKGSGITVTGELTTESWDDKATGAKRHKMLVLVNSAAWVPKHEKSERQTTIPAPLQPGQPAPSTTDPDDVPF